MAPPTAKDTIAMTCIFDGCDPTADPGGSFSERLLNVELPKEMDRVCALRENPAPRAKRAGRFEAVPCMIRKSEREGTNATIACDGGR